MSRSLLTACAGLILAIMTPVLASGQSAPSGVTLPGGRQSTASPPSPSVNPSTTPGASGAAQPSSAAQGAPSAAGSTNQAPTAGAAAGPSSSTGSAAVQAPPAPVPDSFRNIRLGMTLDQVKGALEKDPYFDYKGPPDVSMLASPDENLIETSGYSFIKRAFFQFYDKKLYIMIIMLNSTDLSYYTMYTTLTTKYGPSTSLSPDEVVWESPQVRLSLERPLSVKYIDLSVFNRLKEAGKMKQSERSVSRDAFLSQF